MEAQLSELMAKVWLLYLKCMRGDGGRLSLNILREVCSYLHTHIRIAAVFYSTAFLYDLKSQQSSKHVLSEDLGEGGSYIQADRNTLLCVDGNYSPSSAVHSLDLSSFLLRPLPSLSTPRAWAGLAKVSTSFYMFGVWDNRSGLSSCEKMQLSDQHWTKISSMHHSRVCFTSCHYRSLLYLASTNDHKTVETFSAETQLFAVLPVSLPLQLEANWSVAFIVKGELCLLTIGKQMACWKIESECEFRLARINKTSFSTQQPLIVGSLVLIACLGKVQQFSFLPKLS